MRYTVEKNIKTDYHGGKMKIEDVDFFVVHHTAGQSLYDMEIGEGDTNIKVSFHLLVTDPDETNVPRIIQYLPFDTVGWHAGKGSYKGITSMNSRSLGMEISWHSRATDDFDESQVDASAFACAYAMYKIGKRLEIIKHKDYAPSRKTDVDATFPWDKFLALVDKYYDELVGTPSKPKPPVSKPKYKISSSATKKTLKKGSPYKAEVRVLQGALKYLGYNIGDVDGLFGSRTYSGVLNFQKHAFPNARKEWDGVVGSKTWAALVKHCA